MYFDRFDICEAYYLFAVQYHGGQWSKEYAVLGRLERLRFRARPGLNDEDDLSDNAREIYQNLVSGASCVRARPSLDPTRRFP